MPTVTYHHGGLREALLTAAAREVASGGPSAVTLRALAREVGVSHTAPRHHFGDKRGVLTALAAQGYTELGERVRAANAEGFLAAGIAYVLFAADRPGHFPVMFRPDLVDTGDPELCTALDRLSAGLYAGAATMPSAPSSAPAGSPGNDGSLARAGWSIAHGLATLVTSGTVTGPAGRPLTRDELADLARSTLRHLGR